VSQHYILCFTQHLLWDVVVLKKHISLRQVEMGIKSENIPDLGVLF